MSHREFQSIEYIAPDFKEQTKKALKKDGHVQVGIDEPSIEIWIRSRPDNRIRVTARSAIDQALIGRISSPNQKDENHRPLKVEGAEKIGFKNSYIATKILSIINSIEGKPEFEAVPHYELIRFYIKEGYVPIRRLNQSGNTVDLDLDKLFRGLVEFQTELKQGQNPSYDIWTLPKTILQSNPEAAEKYWNSIVLAVNED